MQQQQPSGDSAAGAGHWCAQVVYNAQTAPQTTQYQPQAAPAHSQYSSYSTYSQSYAPNPQQGYQYNQGGYQYYQQPQQQAHNAYYTYPAHAQTQTPPMQGYYASYNGHTAPAASTYTPPAGAYYAQTPATQAATQHTSATTATAATPAARPQPAMTVASTRPNPARFQAAAPAPAPAPPPAPATAQPWPPSLSRFCERAFKECETSADRKLMEDYLRDILNKVTTEKRLHVHKWELEVVPSLETLRAQAAAPPADASRKRSRWQNAPQQEAASAPHGAIGLKAAGSTKKAARNFVVDDRELQMRQQRMRRFQQQGQNGGRREQKKRKQQRMQHFEPPQVLQSGAEIDLDQFIVKGTCTELEKDYFRLTSAPDPSTVRPKPVLQRALARLRERWQEKDVEYLYMCSQLKAIRQDLTVQHIKDEFTVEVYEFHGRVALEEGDLNEYNQCQTQLKELYRMGLPGCQLEFTAYRILYYLYMLGNKKYSTGSAELMRLIAELPESATQDPGVAHALLVRKALFDNNYHRFFLLYGSTPNHGVYILDMCVDRIRVDTLRKMLKAYRPTIPVNFIQQELAFDDMDQCLDFCRKCNLVVPDDGNIDAKNAQLDPTELFQQNSLL